MYRSLLALNLKIHIHTIFNQIFFFKKCSVCICAHMYVLESFFIMYICYWSIVDLMFQVHSKVIQLYIDTFIFRLFSVGYYKILTVVSFPGGSDSKEIHLQCERPGFDSWAGQVPWRRAWQPTPVFLPGESPWTEEPGSLQSMGSQTIRHSWATKYTHTHTVYYKSLLIVAYLVDS